MSDETRTVTVALVEAWNDGHRAGIGCGHDLAVCRHDDVAVAAEIDDLASWNKDVAAALRGTAAQADGGEPITGRDVHREWRDGMLAQGREVPTRRLQWASLSDQDRELDERIASRLRAAQADGPDLSTGTTTDCPLPGVHDHPFRGPHRFHEWDPAEYRAAQADTAPGGGLDAAWAAAEAALPEGWHVGRLLRTAPARLSTQWFVEAQRSGGQNRNYDTMPLASGPTPDAALLALAARLAPPPAPQLVAEPVADANGDELEHGEPDYPSQYDPQDNRWDLAAKAQRDGDHAEPPVSGQFGAARERQGGGS